MTSHPVRSPFFGTTDSDFDPEGQVRRDGFESMIAVIKRNKWHILACVAVSVALGVAFILQSVTQYTAATSVMIDSKQVGVNSSSPFEGALSFDAGAVDSQVLLIQSDRIASGVIDHLDLLHNAAFINHPESLLETAKAFVKGRISAVARRFGIGAKDIPFADLPVDIQRDLLVKELQANLKVTRNSRTYVINLEYTDSDPALARSIAETFASVYLQDELASRIDVARRAGDWLDERTVEIKAKADRAASAAEDYRTSHALTLASGRLINEQALTDANTQLSAARNDQTSAQAKYDRLKQIVDSKDYTGSSLDALSDPIIATLQTKYLEAYKMNADISARISPNHASAVRARKDMGQYSQVIGEELGRLLDTYSSEVKISAARVASLEGAIQKARSLNNTDSAAMSKLNELQQVATTYGNLYNGYLQKSQELIQQNAIPITDARIISDAQLPLLPSHPKKLVVILAFLVLGVVLGAAVVFLREFIDRAFRTMSQVREDLGFSSITYLPKLPKSAFLRLDPSRSAPRLLAGERTFASRIKAFDAAIDDSMSTFAESLRSIKIAMDTRFNAKRPVVVGFVSALPNEGKSTVAKNFASLLARSGESVLLIDCDLRNPHLTRSLTPGAQHGVLDLLAGNEIVLEEVLHREVSTGLEFLPASAGGRVPATGDLLASVEMTKLMQSLRSRFSVIVIDFGPLHLLTDASAAAASIDGYQLVVEWGRTPRASVVAALAEHPAVAGKMLGVSLSKVSFADLRRYGGDLTYGYGDRYMTRYYLSP